MKRKAIIVLIISGVVIFGLAIVLFVSMVLSKSNGMGEIPEDVITTQTEAWEPPTGNFVFEPEVNVPTEKEVMVDDIIYQINCDSVSFNITDSTLSSFKSFIADEFVQAVIADFFYDIEVVYYPETYSYIDGVMSVKVDGYEEGMLLTFMIDTNEGIMSLY